MSEQIFSIEVVRQRVLDALAGAGGALTTGTLAARLGLPLYAVDAALESAFGAGLVCFSPGPGWRLPGPVAGVVPGRVPGLVPGGQAVARVAMGPRVHVVPKEVA